MSLNKRAKKALEVRLDKLGVVHTFVEAENKIIITDENGELNKTFITEYGYPHSLSDELRELDEFMGSKYDCNFECEWSGTFSIILDRY